MIKRLAVKLFDLELSFIRWLVQRGFTTGDVVLPTVLKIRQARERVIDDR